MRRHVLLGGGIGAGKSRVASVFADRGFTVVAADEVGHAVLRDDRAAIAAVADLWPEAVSDGAVDRATLAGIVFADRAALMQLEAITHPAIVARLREEIAAADAPVVVEIPVMKVLAKEPYLRVAVIADAQMREDRAVARGSNRDDVRRRMRLQPSDVQWIVWADRVIDNSGDWDETASIVHDMISEVLADD